MRVLTVKMSDLYLGLIYLHQSGIWHKKWAGLGEESIQALFFTLKNVIYLFKQINDPSEQCIDKGYRTQQSCDLMDVMKLLANPFSCHKQLIESALGNPQGDRTPTPPVVNAASVTVT